MSKKITEAMLKGLVERVLSEEQLNEKGLPVIGINSKNGREIKDELGIDGSRPSLDKIKQIASTSGKTDDLEKIDFAKVFSETTGRKMPSKRRKLDWKFGAVPSLTQKSEKKL